MGDRGSDEVDGGSGNARIFGGDGDDVQQGNVSNIANNGVFGNGGKGRVYGGPDAELG